MYCRTLILAGIVRCRCDTGFLSALRQRKRQIKYAPRKGWIITMQSPYTLKMLAYLQLHSWLAAVPLYCAIAKE